MDWSELLNKNKNGPDTTYEGTIKRAPSALNEPAVVTLERFDDELEWGPCAWEPRVRVIGGNVQMILPSVGDRCCVVMAETTDDGEPEPWIVAWTPYG